MTQPSQPANVLPVPVPVPGQSGGTVPVVSPAVPTPGAVPDQPAAGGEGAEDGDEIQGETFNKAQVQKLVRERLARAREAEARKTEKVQADAAAAAKAAQEKAETEALKAKGDLQQVITRQDSRIQDLEAQLTTATGQAQRLAVYETAVKTQVTQLRAMVPVHFHTLLDRLDPAEQLTWIIDNQERLLAPATTPPPTKPIQSLPVPASPAPENGADRAAEIDKKRKGWAATMRRSIG